MVCRWLSAYCKVDFIKHICMWTQKAWLPSLDNITQSQNDSCQSNHQFGRSISFNEWFLSLRVTSCEWIMLTLIVSRCSQPPLTWSSVSEDHQKPQIGDTSVLVIVGPPTFHDSWPLGSLCVLILDWQSSLQLQRLLNTTGVNHSLLRKFSDYLNLTYEKTKREDTKKRPEQRDGQARHW